MDLYNCLNCGKELNKARNTKKYCSSFCRLKHFRRLSVSNVETVNPLSVSKEDVSVSPEPEIEPTTAEVSVSETLKAEKIRIAKEAIERAISKSAPMWEEPIEVEVVDDGELKYEDNF